MIDKERIAHIREILRQRDSINEELKQYDVPLCTEEQLLILYAVIRAEAVEHGYKDYVVKECFIYVSCALYDVIGLIRHRLRRGLREKIAHLLCVNDTAVTAMMKTLLWRYEHSPKLQHACENIFKKYDSVINQTLTQDENQITQ